MARMDGSSGIRPTALVEAVISHAVSHGDLAPATLREFADVMRRFARYLERGLGIVDIAGVQEGEVEAFIGSRREDGRRPSLSQQHNRRTVCRYLFRTARSLGLCRSDPAGALRLPPRQKRPPRPLTDREVVRCRARSVSHPQDLRHPLAWALAEASARTSEIPLVVVGDVDLIGVVRLPGSPRCVRRTVPLTEWGLIQVRRRVETPGIGGGEPLVPFRSREVPRATAGMAVIEVLRASGIGGPDVRPMSVVAWRARDAHRQGASIEEVAALLGVRSLDAVAALIGFAGEGDG
jgi:integrase